MPNIQMTKASLPRRQNGVPGVKWSTWLAGGKRTMGPRQAGDCPFPLLSLVSFLLMVTLKSKRKPFNKLRGWALIRESHFMSGSLLKRFITPSLPPPQPPGREHLLGSERPRPPGLGWARGARAEGRAQQGGWDVGWRTGHRVAGALDSRRPQSSLLPSRLH